MATNFLEAAGTGGFITAATTVAWVTALAALANGSATTSSTVFSSATFGQARLLQGYFTSGGTTTMATTAGGCLAFWWLLSTDGGTTFETLVSTPSTTVMALPRPPDFIIPLFDTTALPVLTTKFAAGPFRYPYLGAKLVMQNLSGAAINSATGGTPIVVIGGVADQY